VEKDGATAEVEERLGNVEGERTEASSCVFASQVSDDTIEVDGDGSTERQRARESLPLEGPPTKMTAFELGMFLW
jgi:hypothetical protein